jgi:hypothetical protein
MLNIRVVTWALGTFTFFSYLVCIAYGLVAPQSLHMHRFLEITLPGFKWLTFWRFLLGVGESFLYGVYAGLVYTPFYNFFHKKWGGYPERGNAA